MKNILFSLLFIVSLSLNLSAASYSMEFDGINDHIDCGNDPSLTEFNEMTIEAWVWLQDSNPDQKIISKVQGWYSNYYIFGVGSGTFFCEVVAGGNTLYFTSGSVPSQEWTHLALTFRKGEGGNNGCFYGYINGEVVFAYDSVPDAAISAGNPEYPFRIGAASWDSNYFQVDGSIDEVRIWNTERTSSEILGSKDIRLEGTEPGLAAYYPMAVGSGLVLGDYSINLNTGTLMDGGIPAHGPVWTTDSFRPFGDGSSESPYLVKGLRHLYWMSVTEDVWSDNFEQTADIDASPTSLWYNGSGFTPISGESSYSAFLGNYDGNGFVIDGLFINRDTTTKVGLFTRVHGSIINLGLTNVDITGHWTVGGLAGSLRGSVNTCYITGSVGGESHVGGIAGSFHNYAVNCYSLCNVNGYGWWVGGLFGTSFGGTVINCFSASSVAGDAYVGSLVGYNDGYVYNSFWDTQVSGWTSTNLGTGKTTAQMKDIRTYTDLAWSPGLSPAWDFYGNQNDDTGNEDIWGINSTDNDGYPFLMWQGYSVPLYAPENVLIITNESSIELSWEEVYGATSYKVYSSADPYSGFEEDTSGTFVGESWSAPLTDVKKFYYVKAYN
jgi:hypothetical protein